jgi:hypothetical protein
LENIEVCSKRNALDPEVLKQRFASAALQDFRLEEGTATPCYRMNEHGSDLRIEQDKLAEKVVIPTRVISLSEDEIA